MLTDTALRALKPRSKPSKSLIVMGYVHVATSGTITFRLDYRLHGRRKTVTFGRYGGPASIATFVRWDRSLSPTEIRVMLRMLKKVPTLPTIRLGMRLYLLTLV